MPMTPRQLVTITKMIGLYKISKMVHPPDMGTRVEVHFTRGGFANVFEDGRAQYFEPRGNGNVHVITHTAPAPF
jgi:hypothetical protein